MKRIIQLFIFLSIATLMASCADKCPHKNVEVQSADPATCSYEGATGDEICLDCGKVLRHSEVIPMLEHTPSSTPFNKEPTCMEEGLHDYVGCEVCGGYISDGTAVPSLGHVETFVGRVEPTCVDEGYSGDIYCERCGEILFTGEAIPAGEHYFALHNYVAPTCNSWGYTGDIMCTGCGEIQEAGVEIEPFEHDIAYRNSINATCTREGYTGDPYCIICGCDLGKGRVVPKEEHWVRIKNYKNPSCSEEGYTGDQYCERCNTVLENGQVIPKTDHWITVEVNRIEATTTSDGYTGDIVCKECGALIYKGEYVPVLPVMTNLDGISSIQNTVLKEMNEARAAEGLPALEFDHEVYKATRIRANEYRYWCNEGNHEGDPHHRPNKDCYYRVFPEVGISVGAYVCHGENLAATTIHEEICTLWMNSTKGHREAILNPDYTHVGICVIEQNGVYYACAIFRGAKY